jgi:hypothetical protein
MQPVTIVTALKSSTNALHTRQIAGVNEVTEMIEKSLGWDLLQHRRELLYGSIVDAIRCFTKEFLDELVPGLTRLARAPRNVAAHIANGENCPVANDSPFPARFLQVQVSTVKGREFLFSQSDCSIDASAIRVLISFRSNDVLQHAIPPTRQESHGLVW